jgi:hypothetical protein
MIYPEKDTGTGGITYIPYICTHRGFYIPLIGTPVEEIIQPPVYIFDGNFTYKKVYPCIVAS